MATNDRGAPPTEADRRAAVRWWGGPSAHDRAHISEWITSGGECGFYSSLAELIASVRREARREALEEAIALLDGNVEEGDWACEELRDLLDKPEGET